MLAGGYEQHHPMHFRRSRGTLLEILNDAIVSSTALYDYHARAGEYGPMVQIKRMVELSRDWT